MSEENIKEFCQWPRCNAVSEIIYIGKGICNKHWVLACETPIKETYKKLSIEWPVKAGE